MQTVDPTNIPDILNVFPYATVTLCTSDVSLTWLRLGTKI